MSQLTANRGFIKQVGPVMIAFCLLAMILPGISRGDINEGFDDFDSGTRPAGWIFTGCNLDTDTYTTATNYGIASPSIKLDATDWIQTSDFVTLDRLTFWVKGLSVNPSSAFLIEEFYSAAWAEMTTLVPPPDSGTTIGPLTINSLSTSARFTYVQGDGNVAFDDVAINNTPTPIPSATPPPSPTVTPKPMVDQVYPWSDPGPYVMLYNPGPQFSLQSWKLEVFEPLQSYYFTAADTMPAVGYYLVGRYEWVDGVHPDSMWDISMPENSEEGHSYVMLLNPSSAQVDSFGWGTDVTGQPDFFETTAAGTLSADKAWSRTDHVDTDNNWADFSEIDPAPVNSDLLQWYTETIVPDSDYDTLFNIATDPLWNVPERWPYYAEINEIPADDFTYIGSTSNEGEVNLRRFGFSNPARPQAYYPEKTALAVHLRGKIAGSTGAVNFYTDFNSASSSTGEWTVDTVWGNTWDLMARGVEGGFFYQTELDNFAFTLADFKEDTSLWRRVSQLNIVIHTADNPTPAPSPTPSPYCKWIHEGFDNLNIEGAPTPIGWLFSDVELPDDTYTSIYGEAIPSIKLGVNQASIETTSELYFANPGELWFWVDGVNISPNSHLLIRQWSEQSDNWYDMTDIYNLPSTGTTLGPFNADSWARRYKFQYFKYYVSGGNLAIDDICLCSGPPTPSPTSSPLATRSPTPVQTRTPTPTPSTSPTPRAITPTPTTVPLTTPTPGCIGDGILELGVETTFSGADWPTNISYGAWQHTDTLNQVWTADRAFVNPGAGGNKKLGMRAAGDWFEFPPVNYPGEVTFNLYLSSPGTNLWDEALMLEWIDPRTPEMGWAELTEVTTLTYHTPGLVTYLPLPLAMCAEECVQFRLRVSRRTKKTLCVDNIIVTSNLCPTRTPTPTPTPFGFKTPTVPPATATPTPVGYKTVTPTPLTPTPSITPSPSITPTPSALTPTPTPVGFKTPSPTPVPIKQLVVDQVFTGTGYSYAMIFNPTEYDVNLGLEELWLLSQEDYNYGQDYIFTECDIIPAGGYFLVSSKPYPGGGTFTYDTADAVTWLRIVQNSTAGNSFIATRDPDDEGDALGWGSVANPDYYEGTPAWGALTEPSAWFRFSDGQNHRDTDDNATDFTRLTHSPVGSGQVDFWFCQTLWPVADVSPQEWTKTTSVGNTYYYQAIGSNYLPTDIDHSLQNSSGTGTGGQGDGAETWFELTGFPGTAVNDFVDCWGRVNVQLVAWGVQSGTATSSNVWLKSGPTVSTRSYKFPTTLGIVDNIPTWNINPDTYYHWTWETLGNLNIGIENDDAVNRVLTQFYALVWYTGSEPPAPTATPTTTASPFTPTPTPAGYKTPTPTPSIPPTPTPSPSPAPSPAITPVFEIWNPSFEYVPELIGWDELGTSTQIGWSEDTAYHGIESCLFVNPTEYFTARGVRSTLVSMVPGLDYNFSGWFYVKNTAGVIEDTLFSFQIEWWDSEWGYIDITNSLAFSLASFDTWEFRTYTLAPPPNAVMASLKVSVRETEYNSNDAYIDMFFIGSPALRKSFFIW
jgi:hypothetical protein